MRVVTTAAALGLWMVAASAHAADPRHYDCSKAGNANKAACKAAGAPAGTTPVAPAPAKTRTYDCTKPGNKAKAACKSQTSGPSASPPAAQAAPTRNAPEPTVSPAARSAKSSAPAAAAPSSAPAAAQAGGSPRIVAWTEKNGKVVHYDCSKSGNLNKKACKAP